MMQAAVLILLMTVWVGVQGYTRKETSGLSMDGKMYFCNYDRKRTPQDADRACRGRGMILARPKGDRHSINRIRKHCTYHVREADDWFNDWRSRSAPEPFWLAGKREPNGNYFTWWDDEIISSSAWVPGQPNMHLDDPQRCVEGIHGLNDIGCDRGSTGRFYVWESDD